MVVTMVVVHKGRVVVMMVWVMIRGVCCWYDVVSSWDFDSNTGGCDGDDDDDADGDVGSVDEDCECCGGMVGCGVAGQTGDVDECCGGHVGVDGVGVGRCDVGLYSDVGGHADECGGCVWL